ncbi:MAG: type II secretion system F family protein [Thermogemmata sp.]|nr:type II secretion system F family protein [Thermogemmata sp.]
MELLAFLTAEDVLPILVFAAIAAGVFWILSAISQRNSLAEERLKRLSRSPSLVELELEAHKSKEHLAGLKDMIGQLGEVMDSGNEPERNSLRVKLANAGFRSERAVAVYQGIRLICLLAFLFPALFFFLLKEGFTLRSIQWVVILGGIGFYLPQIVLWYLRTSRQKEIFLTLPDALDLLVVCVESGLGLDAAMRKVTHEMKNHAKVLCEEFELANMQLQMGRPRREVLHDLGVRTGVDDVRALAAILIQADRFGSSIAHALRVQSDSMRTRRRQLAEEKAAKTAVQLIFPLVLFIFPAIFVVLVGPAAIQIQKGLLNKGG